MTTRLTKLSSRSMQSLVAVFKNLKFASLRVAKIDSSVSTFEGTSQTIRRISLDCVHDRLSSFKCFGFFI
ncbi:unnamed protein product [Haemonchus placei]|uniref:Uncharacterized protein n=1 Tax=Haemonchus placei TaxID=6290 RepID=A0A3P7U0I1_HAEPC|nr:unnamed protein product [Haemonchus placei]